jgi:DNA-directed RNA polymerase subunit F
MSERDIVDAINDLSRIILAVNGIVSKSDAIRRLNSLSIPPSRIADILSMDQKDVTSVLSKDKKKLIREEMQ